jgi:hypothetical protein
VQYPVAGRASWRANLLLLGVSSILALLLVEGGLRLGGFAPQRSRLQTYEFDEVLGWKPRASHRTFRSTSQYAHFTYFDADSFACPANRLEQHADRSVESIALIGDSFVEGYYLPYEETFAARLAENTGLQVLNLGVSGYSPGQYLLRGRRHLGEFRLAAVVVFLFPFNDLPYIDRDTYQGYAKPLFRAGETVPGNLPLKQLRGQSTDTGLEGLVERLAIWSVLKPWVGRALLGFEETLEPTAFEARQFSRAIELIRQLHLEFPETPFYVYLVPMRRELLRREVFDHNATLFVEACAAAGLRCELPEPFLRPGIDVDALYIPRDEHFSALGSAQVADHLQRILALQVGLRE